MPKGGSGAGHFVGPRPPRDATDCPCGAPARQVDRAQNAQGESNCALFATRRRRSTRAPTYANRSTCGTIRLLLRASGFGSPSASRAPRTNCALRRDKRWTRSTRSLSERTKGASELAARATNATRSRPRDRRRDQPRSSAPRARTALAQRMAESLVEQSSRVHAVLPPSTQAPVCQRPDKGGRTVAGAPSVSGRRSDRCLGGRDRRSDRRHVVVRDTMSDFRARYRSVMAGQGIPEAPVSDARERKRRRHLHAVLAR